MSRGAKIALSFVAGLVAGYVLSIAGYVIATSTGAFDSDGGIAMGVAFMIGPVVALVCGVLAAVLAGRRNA